MNFDKNTVGRKLMKVKNIFKSSPKLEWSKIKSSGRVIPDVYRSSVPGGWLISNAEGGLVFLPDPSHSWDGGSLEQVLNEEEDL